MSLYTPALQIVTFEPITSKLQPVYFLPEIQNHFAHPHQLVCEELEQMRVRFRWNSTRPPQNLYFRLCFVPFQIYNPSMTILTEKENTKHVVIAGWFAHNGLTKIILKLPPDSDFWTFFMKTSEEQKQAWSMSTHPSPVNTWTRAKAWLGWAWKSNVTFGSWPSIRHSWLDQFWVVRRSTDPVFLGSWFKQSGKHFVRTIPLSFQVEAGLSS